MNKQQLASLIWDSCNDLRGSISAVEYKDVILGLIFYRFVSEKEVMELKKQDWTDEAMAEELNEEERILIAHFDSRVKQGKGYNISEGGDWGDISEGLSEEDNKRWRQNISKSCAGKRNGFYGRKHTEESRKLISEHHADFSGENHPIYGKHLSESTKRKIGEAGKGRIPWNKGLTKSDPRVAKNTSHSREGIKYHLTCHRCGLNYIGNSPSQRCPNCLAK